MPIVEDLGSVHGYRDAEAMRIEVLDQGRREQRGIRGQGEIHGLTGAARRRRRIGHDLLDQCDVGERLAAEEYDVHALARAPASMSKSTLRAAVAKSILRPFAGFARSSL